MLGATCHSLPAHSQNHPVYSQDHYNPFTDNSHLEECQHQRSKSRHLVIHPRHYTSSCNAARFHIAITTMLDRHPLKHVRLTVYHCASSPHSGAAAVQVALYFTSLPGYHGHPPAGFPFGQQQAFDFLPIEIFCNRPAPIMAPLVSRQPHILYRRGLKADSWTGLVESNPRIN